MTCYDLERFWDWALGYGVWSLEFGVWGLGFGVWGSGVWIGENPTGVDFLGGALPCQIEVFSFWKLATSS